MSTIKFSILTPLYNTNTRMLKEMLNSVLNQTYGNWELCIVNASDDDHNDVEKICLDYKDSRIKYLKTENKGISENTNLCLKMATGDYYGCLDHDDLLHSNALMENYLVINELNPDIIYSDEQVVSDKTGKVITKTIKPDFSPDFFYTINYLCHFTVFKSELSKRIGNFKTECNGAQDFDYFLRLCEVTSNIYHIRKILYTWRSHSNSTLFSDDNKRYVLEGAKHALNSHFKRLGIKACSEDARIVTSYKINYEILNNPSVLIIVKNNEENFTKIETTYRNSKTLYLSKDESSYENINEIIMNEVYNHYILLDSKVVPENKDWLQELLMFSQRKDVAFVSGTLYQNNRSIFGGIAYENGQLYEYYINYNKSESSHINGLDLVRNVSSVNDLCLMFKREIIEQLGYFDEKYSSLFGVIYLCLLARERKLLNIITPYCEFKINGELNKNDYTKDKKTFNEKYGSKNNNCVDPYLMSTNEEFIRLHSRKL